MPALCYILCLGKEGNAVVWQKSQEAETDSFFEAHTQGSWDARLLQGWVCGWDLDSEPLLEQWTSHPKHLLNGSSPDTTAPWTGGGGTGLEVPS